MDSRNSTQLTHVSGTKTDSQGLRVTYRDSEELEWLRNRFHHIFFDLDYTYRDSEVLIGTQRNLQGHRGASEGLTVLYRYGLKSNIFWTQRDSNYTATIFITFSTITLTVGSSMDSEGFTFSSITLTGTQRYLHQGLRETHMDSE